VRISIDPNTMNLTNLPVSCILAVCQNKYQRRFAIGEKLDGSGHGS
jgi:hypothetical protein